MSVALVDRINEILEALESRLVDTQEREFLENMSLNTWAVLLESVGEKV